MSDHDEWLDAAEAAAYCDCSPKTIWKYSRPGADPFLQNRPSPMRRLFKKEWLDEWLKAHDEEKQKRRHR